MVASVISHLRFKIVFPHFMNHVPSRSCAAHQGHPHAVGELRCGTREPERVGAGQDEGHGHWGKTWTPLVLDRKMRRQLILSVDGLSQLGRSPKTLWRWLLTSKWQGKGRMIKEHAMCSLKLSEHRVGAPFPLHTTRPTAVQTHTQPHS